jgi:prepilin-type processing-associated H-X9-DG protein
MNLRARRSNLENAFTRTELIFISCLLALLVALGAVALIQARFKQQQRTCVNNLKNVGLAFRIWSTDSSDDFPFQRSIEDSGTREFTNVWQHFLTMSNELSEPRILICPTSSKNPSRTWQTFSDQNISYFIGITAKEIYPQSFLTGDTDFFIDGQPPQSNPVSISTNSNISYPPFVHRSNGNICMGDGSVQKFASAQLKESLRHSEIATNTLLLPR